MLNNEKMSLKAMSAGSKTLKNKGLASEKSADYINTFPFQKFFNEGPEAFLILAADIPHFTVVAASDSYLHATKTKREEILGKGVFEVFPDNPNEPEVKSVEFATDSFTRVVKERRVDVMGIREHDIRRPESEGGGFEIRYWNPTNYPIFGVDGRVIYIIHQLKDVTALEEEKMELSERKSVTLKLKDSRSAAVLLMKEALESRRKIEVINESLKKEIAERKKAEKALGLREAHYHTLFSSIGEGFELMELIFDKNNAVHDLRYLEVNDTYEKQTGLKAKDVLGKTVKELFPKIEEMWIEVFGKVIKTGLPTRLEDYHRDTNRYYSAYYFPFGKKEVGVLFTDITEHKKAEDQIRQNQKTFYELVERSPFGIYIVDSQFRIAHMNISSQNGAFRNVRPIIGRPFNDAMHILWPDQVAEEIISHFRRTLETGEPYYSSRFTNPRNDVEIVESYEWELQRIRLPDGQYGVICYYFDSSKLRETERALTEAQSELKNYAADLERLVEERTKQLKDTERLAAIGATAGMVGHDIRNPLQAITSDVYLIKTELALTPDTEEKNNSIERLTEIEKNIDYINKIVADLQDYARPLNPRVQESDIKAIVQDTIVRQRLPKEFKLVVNIEEQAQKIMGDPDYFKRIINNLVLNAVQAMPNGGTLTVNSIRDKQSGEFVLTVEDTGVGIPDDVKDKLFTPMFTTKSKGQGFGLAVVKRMTETLGGTVTFESEHDKGTKFIVRLPPPQVLNGKWTFK